jgi:hypothetical protein
LINDRQHPFARRLGWFMLIWLLSVAALGVLAWLIRWVLL